MAGTGTTKARPVSAAMAIRQPRLCSERTSAPVRVLWVCDTVSALGVAGGLPGAGKNAGVTGLETDGVTQYLFLTEFRHRHTRARGVHDHDHADHAQRRRPRRRRGTRPAHHRAPGQGAHDLVVRGALGRRLPLECEGPGLRADPSDEPTSLGGGDAAPNPVEQLLGALGNCLAVGYAANASVAGISIERLDITLDGDLDLRSFLGLAEAMPGSRRSVPSSTWSPTPTPRPRRHCTPGSPRRRRWGTRSQRRWSSPSALPERGCALSTPAHMSPIRCIMSTRGGIPAEAVPPGASKVNRRGSP